MRISDWSSDVCSSDLAAERVGEDIGAHIADVRIVVDRWPARIDTRLAGVDGLEDFEAARQAVEQLERGGGNPGGGGVGHAAAHASPRCGPSTETRAIARDRKSTRLNSSH